MPIADSTLLVAVAAGAVAFASTNVDDLLVLVAFFADRSFLARHVVIGQLIGQGALITVAILCARLTARIDPAIIGLLGTVPIAMGILRLVRGAGIDPEDDEAAEADARRYGRAAAVAVVTVANGADNLAAWIPFFSIHGAGPDLLIAALFILMTCAWLAIAHAVVDHPRGEAIIRDRGRRALPWVLILLGAYILARSGAPGAVLARLG